MTEPTTTDHNQAQSVDTSMEQKPGNIVETIQSEAFQEIKKLKDELEQKIHALGSSAAITNAKYRLRDVLYWVEQHLS